MEFEWDRNKAKFNLEKHKISFEEAQTVFYDFLSITVSDPVHSLAEERFITVGMTVKNRLVVVAHADRDNNIRIINARLATKKERDKYEEDK